MDAQAVHQSSLVIDMHADTPQRFVDQAWDFSQPRGAGHLDLESAQSGGLNAEFFAAWVEPTEWHGRYAFRALQLIDGVHQQIRRHPDTMCLARSAEEIRAAHRDRKFAALLAIEGGHAIENDLGLLRMYFDLGVRYMTLTWANSNDWADSSGDLENSHIVHHGGLTSFGREVIREMNRLGMMVDVSHVSDETFWQVLQAARAPVIASHSSSRALTDSPRNLTDEQLRAVATNNGVVMVNFYPAFIDDHWRDVWLSTHAERELLYAAAAKPYLERAQPIPYEVPLAVDQAFYAEHLRDVLRRPSLELLIDHFDHVARVAGTDHVGIGSDFDGFAILPEGIDSAADLPKITERLAARGYTEDQLRKLLGGNVLRVMREVEAASEK